MKGENTFALNVEFLQKLLRDGESDPSLKILSMDSSAACNAGDNFMSNVSRFAIVIKDGNDNIDKRFILVKKQLSNAAWREAFGCDLAFRNEAAAYHCVIPGMNEFRGFDNLSFPLCFQASSDYTILEDLKPKGFKMADRREGLDLAHAVLALKELGKFHGTSLAMKRSQPNTFKSLTSSVQEIVFLPEKKNELGVAVLNSLRMAIMALKVLQSAGNDSLEGTIFKLQSLKNSAYEKLLQLVRTTDSLSVICHGDFYINNMMFKYDDSGEPSEVTLIDLQTLRSASLSLDLLYFFSTSLRPGVLSSHFEELLAVYHLALNEPVRKYVPDTPEVSLKEIHEELKSHSTYGLLMGFLLLPAVTALPGTMGNIEEVESFSSQDLFERGLDLLSPGYFRRLDHLVLDYTKLGYL